MTTTHISVKLVLFSVFNDTLQLFLVDNKLPSQQIKEHVSLETTVQNIFETTTGRPLQQQYTEQLYTLSSDNTIHIVYYMLIPAHEIKATDNWRTAPKPSHSEDASIISYAIQRLRWKMEYTNVIYSLLPGEFTLSDLQKTYEAILGKSLDKRNFRKKILSLTFLQPTEKKRLGSARPAQMYTFTERKPKIIHIFL